jgi:hypothetical protein
MAKNRLTPTDLDARLKFVLGITLGMILFFTTMGILYALIFVTQPIGGQSENDKMFFNVLGSVATFITGTLAGLLIGKSASNETQPVIFDEPEAPTPPTSEPAPVEPEPTGKPEGEMPDEQPVDEDWDKD